MKKFLFGPFVFLMTCGMLQGQQDDRVGAERLRDYMLGKRSALGDYLCEQTISASSEASAPVLMAATTNLVFARIGEFGFEFFDTKREVLDGQLEVKEANHGRIKGFTVSAGPVLTQEKSFEYVTLDGQAVACGNGVLEPMPAPYKRDILGGTASQPFVEWPVMFYMYLEHGKVFGLPKTPLEFMQGYMRCLTSEEKDGKLVAWFQFSKPKPNNPALVNRITFDEDMIVRSEWLEVDVDNKHGKLADVSTKWDKSLPDPLPTQVHASLFTGDREVGRMDYIIDFKWHFPGSPAFEQMKKEVDPIMKLPRAMRQVAGAEKKELVETPK